MAQISLSNTGIIDITDIQKLVNAINRHDDLLTQLVPPSTTNLAKTDSTGTTDFSGIFDVSSQMIQYGRKDILSGTTATIKFVDKSFVGYPIITVNADSGYVTVTAITSTGFTVTTSATAPTIYWMAIGTRSA